MKKKIILKRVFHRYKWRILISYNYDESLTGFIRQIGGIRYSNTYKAWYADDNEETLKQILMVLRDKADLDISALTQNHDKEVYQTSEVKNGIPSPVLTDDIKSFKSETRDPEPEIIPARRVIERVVERQRFSPVEIKEGKGRVDRIVPVSKKVWEKMDEYIDGFHPVKYLFEGQSGGRYSVESVYRVFKQALGRAGIKKDVGVHSLRHSYATHLHESGLDIRYIQELLGHKSSRTTEIYTHVSRRNLVIIRSPIEDMDVK